MQAKTKKIQIEGTPHTVKIYVDPRIPGPDKIDQYLKGVSVVEINLGTIKTTKDSAGKLVDQLTTLIPKWLKELSLHSSLALIINCDKGTNNNLDIKIGDAVAKPLGFNQTPISDKGLDGDLVWIGGNCHENVILWLSAMYHKNYEEWCPGWLIKFVNTEL